MPPGQAVDYVVHRSRTHVTRKPIGNAKVSARQQCVHEAPGEETYGKSTQGTQCLKVHSVTYNAVADNTGLSSFVQKLLLYTTSAKSREIYQISELIAVPGSVVRYLKSER